MVNKYIILLIALICLIVPVLAIPTTGAATSITSNSAVLSMTGGTSPMWFIYGQTSGYESWTSPNLTNASATNFTYMIYGSPLVGNTLFYYKGCDSTGCGNELSFTTLSLVPQVQTTFGASLDNITASRFDISVVAGNSIAAYFWLTPTMPTMVWGIIFMGIYLGLWIRQRDLVVPVILGLITGSFILFGDAGLGLGIPVEFQQFAQGLTYAALAGIILALMKRS